VVAFDDDDLVEVIAKYPSSDQTRQTGADNDCAVSRHGPAAVLPHRPWGINDRARMATGIRDLTRETPVARTA
jgi:hypothetical protein